MFCLSKVSLAQASIAFLGLILPWFPTQSVRGDDAEIASAILDQLDASRFTERRAAFLKLCDSSLDIDTWLDEQSQSSDTNRAAICVWLRRIRRMPGTIDDRLSMMGDYLRLTEGDSSVLLKYGESQRTEQAVELLEILPSAIRERLLQIRSAEHPFDAIIDNAWKGGEQDLVPRLLNAILPSNTVRVGLNARWRHLGMPEYWHLDEPVNQPEVQIAALERDGKIDEALAVAKSKSLPNLREQLLTSHGRWEEWLQLDPWQQSVVSPPWNDVARSLLLESLGRHEEALAYYEMRKQGNPKGSSQQIQAAQLALIVGDNAALEGVLKANAHEELVSVYFLRYQLDALLELEGLSDKSLEAIDAWLDKNVREELPLSKAVRFQSLFKRLGYPKLANAISQRIETFVATHDPEHQLQLWDKLISEWPRYGLEEERLRGLAKAMAVVRTVGPTTNGLPAEIPARVQRGNEINARAVTVENLFFKSFPMLRWAAWPIYRTLRDEYPEETIERCVAMVEDLHEARTPSGWMRSDIEPFFRRTLQLAASEGMTAEAVVIDLAETLDAMGMTDRALGLLQEFPSSHSARIQIARLAAKLGRLEDASKLSLQLIDEHPDDLNAYLVASRSLMAAKHLDAWLAMQQRVLTRLDCWSMYSRYTQTLQRTGRMETPPEILFFLELMRDHAPCTWEEMWFGDVYADYGLNMLSNLYHQEIGKRPERAARLADMMRNVCLQEISGLAEDSNQAIQPRTGGSGQWELDWARWCWQYERCLAAGFWQAVQAGDRELADRLIRAVYRMNPEQMNTLIDFAPIVKEKFGEATLREWFDVFYVPMNDHLGKYPNDTLIANNTAWLAAKCGFEYDRALELAQRAVEFSPTDTYLDTLAEVEFVRGNIPRAIEISERCRALQPRDAHHPRQLARFRNKAVPNPAGR